MRKSTEGNGASWLGMIGVGIGLVIALIVDRYALDTTTDRPLVIAGITALVALLWLMALRLVFGPTPAAAKVSKPTER